MFEKTLSKCITVHLTKRFGEVSGEIRSSIFALPLPVLEDLSEAPLDFTSFADLLAWLETVVN